VFDYFTALPLETLSLVFSNPSVVKPYIDLYTEAFPDSPLIEPVSTASGTVFGGRVHGRLNINFAPWWLLDGLPAIPDAWNPAWPLSPSSVPVPQILRDRLDPLGPTIRPGQSLMTMLFDEPSASPAPPLNEPSISPIMAKAIVAYRERRPVDTLTLASTPPHYGCTSVGNLIDLITRLPMDIGVAGATDFSSVRLYHTGVERPYAYLGFLQLVTPLVRLQDWATVKSHVFTIYTLVGDPGNQDDPGDDVWLRSQATVDRTRCLYSNDLPAVITETPPISYYNVVNDQR
jgi:hypothetical protein